jgi:hypothetical protein
LFGVVIVDMMMIMLIMETFVRSAIRFFVL